MCSFLFFRSREPVSEADLIRANRFARMRGPDHTSTLHVAAGDGFHLTFLHNLLDISGARREQPLTVQEPAGVRHLLFNGEIYNYRDLGQTSYSSDSDFLLDYLAQGESGPQINRLDGEFSILHFSTATNSLHAHTDPFQTKPLFFGKSSVGSGFGAATCASSLHALGLDVIELAHPNASYSFRFQGATVETGMTFPRFPFDLNQTSDDFSAWTAAFVEAVRKRATHGAHPPSVFLSSGYDSGAICLALNILEIPYHTFSIIAGEEREVLEKRIAINLESSCVRAHRIRGISHRARSKEIADIKCHVEPFGYVHEDAPGQLADFASDAGAIGANSLARLARKRSRLVNLSGAGADEIMSDYGFQGRKFYHHSEFGGQFPDRLEQIFPWRKFYGDTQRSYLFKDEYILGRSGIEGRYPFLDQSVVQEFLRLSPTLKNRHYKAPLHHFLSENSYPFEPQAKRGFIPFTRPSSAERVWRKLRAWASSIARE